MVEHLYNFIVPPGWEEHALPDLEFTVMHGVGHSVDVKLGLKPARATKRDFVGVRRAIDG